MIGYSTKSRAEMEVWAQVQVRGWSSLAVHRRVEMTREVGAEWEWGGPRLLSPCPSR